MGQRVVITGIGAVTPVGIRQKMFWQNLVDGVSGSGRSPRPTPQTRRYASPPR